MQSDFVPLLSRCRYELTEEQFLAGRPAIFTMDTLGIPGDGDGMRIVAFYQNDKVLIEAYTFWSMVHICEILNDEEQSDNNIMLVDPIIIEDFTKLEETLNHINTNKITTRQVDDKELQNKVGDLYLEEAKANPGFEAKWF